MMANNPAEELQAATDKVLNSTSKKKLVVAGPGAGKTFLFRKLLERANGGIDERVVLTFVNSLKDDLERSLGGVARVFTLHGYCQHLLHREADLRGSLSKDFVCYPGLRSLIKIDWEFLRGGTAPKFVDLMRKLEITKEQGAFYLDRSDYYDAVDFDDSVYRTLQRFQADQNLVPKYELTLVDEFQDFNSMEAGVIGCLAESNAIVIAGDDDQALYSVLRDASWNHIRGHYSAGTYEPFNLPFCMRCPEVIVEAVGEILSAAKKLKKLAGRIDKPFRFFEPAKGEDSRRYPTIDLVRTSVQTTIANYAGKYIEERLRAISPEDLKEAEDKHEPVALIVGTRPYLPQVEKHLIDVGLLAKKKRDELAPRETALQILKEKADSNLGWRIILSLGDERVAELCVREAAEKSLLLVETIPPELRDAVVAEAAVFELQAKDEEVVSETTMNIETRSYESAKGLSSQHVFLVGLHAGDLPRNADNIQDIEICKLLVGLTRTKKKCTVLVTKRFANVARQPSLFLGWIRSERFSRREVDASYWKKKKG